MGWHRFQGCGDEPEELVGNQQEIQQLQAQHDQDLRDAQRDNDLGDHAADNETARKYFTQADALRVASSQAAMRLDHLEVNAKYLMMGRKKVGPDLKEVRVKI